MYIYVAYLTLTVLGLTLVKLDKNQLDLQVQLGSVNISLGFLTITGMACYIVSFLIFMSIIQKNEISIIFPMLNGIVTILTFLVGVVIFGEVLNLNKILGIVIIVVGIFLINYKG